MRTLSALPMTAGPSLITGWLNPALSFPNSTESPVFRWQHRDFPLIGMEQKSYLEKSMVYSAMVGYPFLSNANISAPTASFTYHYFSYTVRAPHYIIRESYKYSRLKTAYFSCLAPGPGTTQQTSNTGLPLYILNLWTSIAGILSLSFFFLINGLWGIGG